MDYQEYLKRACEVAISAGKMIKDAFYEEHKSLEYKGVTDLVTQTDKAVESYIFSTLGGYFPDHLFLGEETHSSQKSSNKGYNWTEKPTWIVDPIDGTTNFVHRFPFVCVSIALAINRKVVVGVVYNPILEEFYRATLGGGAFMNDKPIKVADTEIIEKAVVATNVGYDRTEEGINFMMSNMKNLLLNNVRSMRSGGSAAVEICSVASGRLDVFYEFGIHPWDIAAAGLIATEAGAVFVDPSGIEIDLESRRVLVGNKDIVSHMVRVLANTPIPQKWALKS